jgi:hypothetical protein
MLAGIALEDGLSLGYAAARSRREEAERAAARAAERPWVRLADDQRNAALVNNAECRRGLND